MQSQEIKYIIQTSKQVTTIQYICPTGSQSYFINIKTSKMLAQRYIKKMLTKITISLQKDYNYN